VLPADDSVMTDVDVGRLPGCTATGEADSNDSAGGGRWSSPSGGASAGAGRAALCAEPPRQAVDLSERRAVLPVIDLQGDDLQLRLAGGVDERQLDVRRRRSALGVAAVGGQEARHLALFVVAQLRRAELEVAEPVEGDGRGVRRGSLSGAH